MNFKTTYILFGVLFLMLATLGAVLYFGPTAPTGDKYVFPSFHKKDSPFRADDVTKVTVERFKPDAAPMTFEKQGNDWVMTSPRTMPADGSRVEELINAIIEAKVDEEAKSINRKQAGVDEPSRKITLFGKDREATLTVGTATSGGELALVYVLSSDRPRDPVAVKRNSLASVLENLNSFRGKSLLAGETPDLQSITLTRGNRKVELKKDKDRWSMTDPPYGEANIAELLRGLSGLSVSHVSDKNSDFVKDGVIDLKPYSLDADVLRIEVKRSEGAAAKTQTLLVSDKKDGEKLHATLATGAKGPYDVVKIPASAVEPFTKVLNDPDSLRSKALVDLPTGGEPDAIDIEDGAAKTLLQFRREGMDWKLYRGDTASKLDDNEVRKLITDLTSRTAIVSFVEKTEKEPRVALGVDRPDVVTVRIYANSLGKPDPKKPGKPTPKADALAATLKFGLKREAGVGVERLWGKDSTLAYVPAALADTARRGALAYLEKSIEPFNLGRPDENVTRVELVLDKEKVEITRENDKAPWTFVAPPALKGKKASDTAVMTLIGSFNRPMVNAIERETATGGELRSYGLDSPAVVVKVTVTKDKKPTTYTYEVGSEKKTDKEADRGVFLRVGGKGPVYVVNRQVVSDAKQELRDATIFSFKADDAVTLKITRFDTNEGATVTATFEKKGGQWVRAGVADWKVNQDRLKELLGELSTLRADKFVPAGKEMELKQGAMKLEVTLADKKTYEVTIGGAEGAAFYASSPQHPGTAFLISQAQFPDVKKGFVYLKQ